MTDIVEKAKFKIPPFTHETKFDDWAFYHVKNGPIGYMLPHIAAETAWNAKAEIDAAEITRLREVEKERDDRRDFMEREGYRRCNIAACNCNSWHEGNANRRLTEIRDVLEECGVSTNGVTLVDALRSQLATTQQQLREVVEAFGRLLRHVNIPDKIPDDLWTSCETDDYQMSDVEFEACRSAIRERGVDPDIALKSRSQRLMLWMDGVTIKDFRAAIAALDAIRARAASDSVKASPVQEEPT